jgi:hypothetical protein
MSSVVVRDGNLIFLLEAEEREIIPLRTMTSVTVDNKSITFKFSSGNPVTVVFSSVRDADDFFDKMLEIDIF